MCLTRCVARPGEAPAAGLIHAQHIYGQNGVRVVGARKIVDCPRGCPRTRKSPDCPVRCSRGRTIEDRAYWPYLVVDGQTGLEDVAVLMRLGHDVREALGYVTVRHPKARAPTPGLFDRLAIVMDAELPTSPQTVEVRLLRDAPS
jgi:hypothetical protein